MLNIPPLVHCSKYCCPTLSSALWIYLGRGNGGVLAERQSCIQKIHTTIAFMKPFSIRVLKEAWGSQATLWILEKHMWKQLEFRCTCIHRNLFSLHRYKKKINDGINDKQAVTRWRNRALLQAHSLSQQTYLVPSALLIGNESTEWGPLIANESWVIHCVCWSACLFGWARGFWGCLWPKTEHTCIIHQAETRCMCECE